jgi:leucine dehydrogenase
VRQAIEELGANAVRPHDIYGLDVDVFAPCAMGGILNAETLQTLRAPVIAGAANNQLASPEIGAELQRRNHLYAPDYAINAGGIIDVYYQRVGGSAAQSDAHIRGIAETLREIFERAASSGESTSIVADRLAQERLGGVHAVPQQPQRLQA